MSRNQKQEKLWIQVKGIMSDIAKNICTLHF